MRKVILGLVAVCLLLYVTNPTKSDFSEYVEGAMRAEMEGTKITGNRDVDNIISYFSGSLTKMAADTLVIRKDYYLFSKYEVEGIDMDVYFVGMFRRFFAVEKSAQ